MKKIVLTLLMMIGTHVASAYEYPYLIFETNGGALTALSVESLTLTVVDGELKAVNGNGTQTFPLSELSKMYFATTPTGINALTDDALDLTSEAEVYDLGGRRVSQSLRLSQTNALRSGIYVVKQNGQTRKIVVK